MALRCCDVETEGSWILQNDPTHVVVSRLEYMISRCYRCTVTDHRLSVSVVITATGCTCKLAAPLRSCVAKDIHSASYFSPRSICAYRYPPTDLDCVLGLILAPDWAKPVSCIGSLDSHWRSALSVESYPPPAPFGWISPLPFLSAVGRSRCPWPRMFPSKFLFSIWCPSSTFAPFPRLCKATVGRPYSGVLFVPVFGV